MNNLIFLIVCFSIYFAAKELYPKITKLIEEREKKWSHWHMYKHVDTAYENKQGTMLFFARINRLNYMVQIKIVKRGNVSGFSKTVLNEKLENVIAHLKRSPSPGDGSDERISLLRDVKQMADDLRKEIKHTGQENPRMITSFED